MSFPGKPLALLGILWCAGLSAQAPSSSPAPQSTEVRVTAGTVLLDVVVTDRRNRVVTDLTREDFAVFEDDVLQKIDGFVQRSGSAPAGAGASTPSYLLFLLDFSTTDFENQRLVREAASQFVEKGLNPNDYVAVFYNGTSFGVLQPFTTDRTLLAAALNQQDATAAARAQTAVSPGAAPAAPADGASPVQGVNSALTAIGASAAGAAAATASGAARMEGGLGRMSSAVNQRTTSGVLSAIEAISGAVESLEGRKTLVLFSQGFVVTPHQEPEMERAVAAANRANVAIYTVDSGGLSSGGVAADLQPQDRLGGINVAGGGNRKDASGGESVFDRARMAGGASRDSALRYVAAETGGLAFRNTNDLSVSLGRVAQDMRSHYSLTYRPQNQNFDGRFRRVRVELKREGLTARTRSGYVAAAPLIDGLTLEEAKLMEDARSGLGTSLPFDAVLATFPGGPAGSRVPVTVEIPAKELQFKPVDGKRVASIQIAGLLRDAGGTVVTRVGTPVNVAATPAELKVLEKGSVSFTNVIALTPGRYSFEVLVRDASSGKAAVRNYGLLVPEPGEGLALSSIVLGSQVEPLREGEAGSDLTLGKVKVLPSAARRFRNGDNLVYLFNAYNVGTGPAGTPGVEVRVSIERPGSPALKLPSFQAGELHTDPPPHVTIGRYLELKGLAPGRYVFVAEVEDLASKEVRQARASFELVP